MSRVEQALRRAHLTSQDGFVIVDNDAAEPLLERDDTLLILSRTEHVFGGVDAILTESNLARMYGVPVRRVTVSSETERVEAIIPLHGLR